MARPQIPTRSVVHGKSLYTDSVTEPKLGSAAAGLTAAATAVQRSVTVATVGVTPSTAHNYIVFRAPASGATITGLYFCPGSDQNHAANEADTWIVDVANTRTGLDLSKNAPSLSGVTLASTAWKTIPVNNGNSTVLTGEGLLLKASISGTPAGLNHPALTIEWVPYSNA